MTDERNNLILIVYASKHGQTEKISRRMGDQLRKSGFRTDVYHVKFLEKIPLASYSAVFLGSPVYIGKTNSRLQKWAFKNRDILNNKITGIFTVSLNAANDSDQARDENRKILNKFIAKTGLKPKMQECFIGALNYREYNPLIRLIMKQISSRSGGPTDTSQDHELTRWDAIDKFVQDFAKYNLQPPENSRPREVPQSESLHLDSFLKNSH